MATLAVARAHLWIERRALQKLDSLAAVVCDDCLELDAGRLGAQHHSPAVHSIVMIHLHQHLRQRDVVKVACDDHMAAHGLALVRGPLVGAVIQQGLHQRRGLVRQHGEEHDHEHDEQQLAGPVGWGDVTIAYCTHGDSSPVDAVVKLERNIAFFVDA